MSGVPQGSVSEPMHFNLLIEDLPLHVHSRHVILFAGNCKVFNSFSMLYLEIGSTQDLVSE